MSHRRFLSLLVFAFGAFPTLAYGASAVSADTGYVLMIHSTVEPHSLQALDQSETGSASVDQGKTGTLYASGSVVATRNGDSIVFHAIPYRADTVYPVVGSDPQLEVAAVGSDRRLMLRPNVPADQERICYAETTWAGHEGPVDACSVYKVPVEQLAGMNVVTLTLHFTDAAGRRQTRVHSLPVHFLLHMAIEGAPIDLKAVDAAITKATPLVIEHLIDTQPASA
jgi:hypothetical protein